MNAKTTPRYSWRDFRSAPWLYSGEFYKRKGLEDYSYQIAFAGGATAILVIVLLVALNFMAGRFFPDWLIFVLLVPIVYFLRPLAMSAMYNKLISRQSP